jgi:pimeloyl-ACP methyl ester carboxylesterase
MEITLSATGGENSSASALLVLPGLYLTEEQSRQLASSFGTEFSVYVVRANSPSSSEVIFFAEQLYQCLAKERLKRATVLGFDSGGGIAVALSDSFPKFVRRLVLLDTTTRIKPGIVSRFIDGLEGLFPLGLPLRRLGKDFDMRPLLHRIHCPTLILSSPRAGVYLRQQASLLAGRIPNAWVQSLQGSPLDENRAISLEFLNLVSDFLQIPVKRPQKNLKAA